MASWFSCKNTCLTSDPTQDTVKVDMASLECPDKENVQPVQFVKETAAQLDEALEKNLAEARRKDGEEQAKRRREDEEAAKAAAQAKRLRAEMLEANEKIAQAQQRALEIKARQEAEKKAQQEFEAAAEAAVAAAEQLRLQHAAEAQAQREQLEEKRIAELAVATEIVTAWCKKNGFSDMSTSKKTMRGATKFPLHTAVKHQNDEIIGLLLTCGVDQHVQDSRKQSPRQLAVAINKNGSHDHILGLLR